MTDFKQESLVINERSISGAVDPAGGVLRELVPQRDHVEVDGLSEVRGQRIITSEELPSLWALVFAACGGSFLFGYSVSLMNTPLAYIAWEFGWCNNLSGVRTCTQGVRNGAWVSTAVFMGAGLGAIFAPRLLNKGRRFAILLSLWGFVFGTITTAVSSSFATLFWARLVVGAAVGLVSVAVPVYLSEMSPAYIRGKCGIMHQLFIVGGVFMTSVLGLPLTLYQSVGDGSEPRPFIKIWWRCMAALPLLAAGTCYYFLGYRYYWETPHWYVQHGSENVATQLLKGIYKRQEISPELEAIVAELKSSEIAKTTGVNFIQTIIRNKGPRKALVVGIILSAFQQLSGINVFISASTGIFAAAGFHEPWPAVATMLVFMAFFLFTLPSVYIIDSIGRRPLLVVGTLIQTISLIPPAIGALRNPDSRFSQYSAVVGVCVFLVAFAGAYGPVLWVYLFECFPLEIKNSASSIAVTVNWLAAIGLVFAANYLSNATQFTLFAILSGVSFLFVVLFVMETKGRRLGDSPYIHE